jgi:hypothetical protein
MPSPEPIAGRCGAVVKPKPEQGRDGGFCTLPPMTGQTRCGQHGGRAPQAKAAAVRRLQEREIRVAAARYGFPVNEDVRSSQAMQEGLNEAYGNVLALRNLVQRMAPEALTWGTTQVVSVGASQFPGEDITQAGGAAPLVKLYGEERDRLHRIALDCAKLGIEAARLRLDEQTASDFLTIIRGTLTDLSAQLRAGQITTVDPDDPAVVRVLSTRLAALAEAAA